MLAMAPAMFPDATVPRAVNPEPPVTPDGRTPLIFAAGIPVILVATPDAGVTSAGVVSTGESIVLAVIVPFEPLRCAIYMFLLLLVLRVIYNLI